MWTGTSMGERLETSRNRWLRLVKREGHIYVPKEAISYYTTGGRDYKYGPQKNYNRLLTVYANYNRDFDAINSNIDATFGYDSNIGNIQLRSMQY